MSRKKRKENEPPADDLTETNQDEWGEDEWGDPIKAGDTVITLVDDPTAPGGLRPVMWVAGQDEPPE